MPSKDPAVSRRANAVFRKAHPDRVREYQRRWYEKNREIKLAKTKRVMDAKKYGDPDIREKLLAAQGGVCAGCASDHPRNKRGWHVDHCHLSGKVRGVLCHGCNTSLGLLAEDVGALRGLANYAESWK